MEDFTRLLEAEFGLLSRRLRGMAMISRGIVPNLVISQRVVDRVFKAAQSYIADETGESMVGIEVDTDEPETMPTLYVLDTISPDESTIRRSHMFETGDDLQGDLFNWLLDNWNTYLKNGKDMGGKPMKAEWDQPLKHLGDWHKQPGFMIQPSGGDLMTALRIMDEEENEFEFLLVPIVTLGHPSVTSEQGATVNYFNLPQDDGTSLRMDWWYIHRDVRVFQPITPTILPYDELPELPPYPWHILDVDLMDEELALIEEDGMFMLYQTAIPVQIDDKMPLEICFIIGRGGNNKVFIVATSWDYPTTKPGVYIAPFEGIDPSMFVYDVFDALWAKAEKADEPPNFKWDPEDSYIVDYLAHIEKAMGMRPENATMPADRVRADGTVPIAVQIDDDEQAVAPPDDVVEETEAVEDVEATVETDTQAEEATTEAESEDDDTVEEPVAEVVEVAETETDKEPEEEGEETT